MSEPMTARPARRRWLARIGRGLLVLMALGALVLAWAMLPRSLGEIRVDDVRLHPVPSASGDRKAADHSPPARIAVTFTAAEDLERARERVDLGYVAARLGDCRHGAAQTLEVVVQRAEYLRDAGRVRRVDEEGRDGVRYRAEFDDVLTEVIDHEAARSSALATPGGLCFSLSAASMWFGWGQSNVVPVDVRP